MLKEIGKVIRKRRKSLGYSIEQLAEYSETSFSTISRIELGKLNDIHFSTLSRILNALNLNFEISSDTQKQSNMTNLIQLIDSFPPNSKDKIINLISELLELKIQK